MSIVMERKIPVHWITFRAAVRETIQHDECGQHGRRSTPNLTGATFRNNSFRTIIHWQFFSHYRWRAGVKGFGAMWELGSRSSSLADEPRSSGAISAGNSPLLMMAL
ncbi:beta and beta-prime subunits of DNA dependent RNA-polymerase [Anopheles sinensis]|uniref:Beta and beta-prime subunits of DNA dependent RNA-polymerase n=1 Tax=Anopheles sinensis TaxID=74873 RepID=A0A084WBP7_ANOSI|nr:beta and beta-prime subunits of DNA dependent RNA-polymerase [Anopheles sinensis]